MSNVIETHPVGRTKNPTDSRDILLDLMNLEDAHRGIGGEIGPHHYYYNFIKQEIIHGGHKPNSPVEVSIFDKMLPLPHLQPGS